MTVRVVTVGHLVHRVVDERGSLIVEYPQDQEHEACRLRDVMNAAMQAPAREALREETEVQEAQEAAIPAPVRDDVRRLGAQGRGSQSLTPLEEIADSFERKGRQE